MPTFVLVLAPVHYSDVMKRLGTNTNGLLESHGVPHQAMVYDGGVLGIGAIGKGIVRTAQSCLPEEPGQPAHSDLIAILFVQNHGLQACNFYVPSKLEHGKLKSRNRSSGCPDNSRQRDAAQSVKRNSGTSGSSGRKRLPGEAGIFCFSWDDTELIPESIRMLPDAMFFEFQALQTDRLSERYPTTRNSRALLRNIKGSVSGTFIEDSLFTFLSGLAIKSKKGVRFTQETFGQSMTGPEMLAKMQQFQLRVRAECATPNDGTTFGRPIFCRTIGSFRMYPGAVLSQYTA
jgi:hypothetical protein